MCCWYGVLLPPFSLFLFLLLHSSSRSLAANKIEDAPKSRPHDDTRALMSLLQAQAAAAGEQIKNEKLQWAMVHLVFDRRVKYTIFHSLLPRKSINCGFYIAPPRTRLQVASQLESGRQHPRNSYWTGTGWPPVAANVPSHL
jgi:hypothetical protein